MSQRACDNDAMTSVTPTVDDLEAMRGRLTAFCYRMLGSAADTDDAVQETIIRAHGALDRFDPARGQLSTWMHRIAANICIDLARSAARRELAVDLGPARTRADSADLGEPLPADRFVEPMPDAAVICADDPADIVAQRQSVRLAFVAALQCLAPRQRATLLLREVLGFDAAETADILDTSVPAVNSALQRARARLSAAAPEPLAQQSLADPDQQRLLDDYVAAFEAHDVGGLKRVLREDLRMSMPPFAWRLESREEFLAVFAAADACVGDRLLRVPINGTAGFGQYRREGDVLHPFALVVPEIRDGAIAEIVTFLGTGDRFAEFGLPLRLEPGSVPPGRR
ncbi:MULTISPECIES: RNA polymerase subunit sigma-70 [Brevibacterium]|uniref:RNA polymerase subunit sigma-70 n=1 Tax=Brevibacterium TaxID=1696 RepID=UPI0031D159E8